MAPSWDRKGKYPASSSNYNTSRSPSVSSSFSSSAQPNGTQRSSQGSGQNGNSKRSIEVVDLTAEDGSSGLSHAAVRNHRHNSFMADLQSRLGRNLSTSRPTVLDMTDSPTASGTGDGLVIPRAGLHARPSQNSRLSSTLPSRSAIHSRPSISAVHSRTPVINLEDEDEYRRFEREEAASSRRLPGAWVDDDDDVFQQGEVYGTLETKIVGVSYYRGQAKVGEFVMVTRDSANQYDPNAIQIKNVLGMAMGHLPRQVAAKLAPLMDSFQLIIEGILIGEKGAFDCPILLKLVGPSEIIAKQRLMTQMRIHKLPMATAIAREKQQQRQRLEDRDEFSKQRTEDLRRAAAGSVAILRNPNGSRFESEDRKQSEWTNGYQHLPTQPTGSLGNPISLDDIMNQSRTFNPRAVGEVTENFGAVEEDLAKMPMADQPLDLNTKLLPYQRQGLAWMLDREFPKLPAPGSKDVNQLWKRSGNGFVNIATNYSSRNSPELSSGGILADDMGLGKTIQVISLLVADPKRATGRPGPTLIVSPLGVMSNWSGQIEAHVNPDKPLKVFIYHAARRQEVESLQDFDVVITTYGTMSMERPIDDEENRQAGGLLFQTQWRRIVLDEGHQIRNPKSQSAAAACALKANSRWVLTGTPIINTLKDLYSHVRFLKLSGGLSDLSVFSARLIRPLKAGDRNAELLLHALMGTICLRRRKDMKFVDLRLPEFSSHIFTVQWRKHEREKYDAFQSEAKGLVLKRQLQEGGRDYFHIMEVLLRMRQTCNHWKLTGQRLTDLLALLEGLKTTKLNPETIDALQKVLQVRIEGCEDCPICLDTMTAPVITQCTHSFCRDCIERTLDEQKRCPMCRHDIPDKDALVEAAAEIGEDSNEAEEGIEADSSKITALVNLLRATAQKDDGSKTIVFSQWTSFLDVIQEKLVEEGFEFCRIDGKMTAVQRDQSIKALDTDPSCTIMLASLAVCGVGLNLVSANQVILADSWWAPAIEDQAIDRVYRLGQTRSVNVWRLIMEDSIEERVLEIQEEKRKLMATALRDVASVAAKKRKEKRARLADIQRLLGLDARVPAQAQAGPSTQALMNAM